jgi:hypothetical protein
MIDLFDQILENLIEKTKEESIWNDTDFDRGYRMAIYSVLSDVYNTARVFNVDIQPSFSPDDWLRSGREYWTSVKNAD